VQSVKGSDDDREWVHCALFDLLCHLKKVHTGQDRIKALTGRRHAFIGKLTDKAVAMQNPSALDLYKLTGHHSRERQSVSDWLLSQQNVTKQYRGIKIRYHDSFRSSFKYSNGSRDVKGASRRYAYGSPAA